MDHAVSIARTADLAFTTISAPPFTLAAFRRNHVPRSPVVVYIEGDGLAWLSKSQPSHDPTPREPMGLLLAAADTTPNVVYLARPCQYVTSTSCQTEYWTNKRFSEEVVAATNAAIDQLISPGQPVHLVGYSGGGAIAALVAARRRDVASLRTVAGNLDHQALSRYHDVSPMRGSLDAVEVAPQLASLPQLHYVGTRDETVPPLIAESYLRGMGTTRCAGLVRVQGLRHDGNWPDYWAAAASTLPACQ